VLDAKPLLSSQLEDKFFESGQKLPKIIILEGRRRIGGRVYSHPLQRQGVGSLPAGQRSTAEMGAQIVTGFDHGNPLNFIIRGQLALPYHALRDTSILYDCDGQIVDKDKDLRVERLWNDILERAAVFRTKLPRVLTFEGDRDLLAFGQDAKEPVGESAELLSSLEDAGASVTVAGGNAISNKSNAPEHSSVGVEKLAGRQYQHAGDSAKLAAAEAAKLLGWELRPDVAVSRSLDLLPISQSSQHPTLGETMDEGIRQYQDMLGLTAQDLRLMNWHHANLEYANAVSINDLSLGGWDQDVGNEFEGEHTEIIGGYTQVPHGLYQLPTPLDVRFDCAVQHIEYMEQAKDGPRVSIKCANGQSFEADEAVLTASLGVLKYGSISFDPPLPDWKTDCIERMGFGLLNKV
jgi:Flavin containing amine oxidoreductase